MKNRMKPKKYIKICPQCGSINVKMPPAGMDIKMTQRDFCEDCKARGIFPEVEASKIWDFRKKLKNR